MNILIQNFSKVLYVFYFYISVLYDRMIWLPKIMRYCKYELSTNILYALKKICHFDSKL